MIPGLDTIPESDFQHCGDSESVKIIIETPAVRIGLSCPLFEALCCPLFEALAGRVPSETGLYLGGGVLGGAWLATAASNIVTNTHFCTQ